MDEMALSVSEEFTAERNEEKTMQCRALQTYAMMDNYRSSIKKRK
jgi:hypothetical protein